MHSASNTKKLDTFGDVCKGADTRQIYNAPTNVHKTPQEGLSTPRRMPPDMANVDWQGVGG